MLHFGEDDHGIPLADVEKIKRAADPAKVQVFSYSGAGHAFNRDGTPAHHADSAKLARERTLAAFASRDFRLLWGGQSISFIGDAAFLVAIGWRVTDLTGKKIAVKDNICVAGVPMMNGSRVLEGYVPDVDATVVTRILDAGGTIVGKAACEDLCFSAGSHTCATGPIPLRCCPTSALTPAGT